jgi:hypothetical protein
MIDASQDDPAFRRFNAVVTFVICAAVAAAAYRYERQRTRWWRANHPLAAAEASFDRAKTRYRRRRADVRDLREGVANISGAVHLARSGDRRRATERLPATARPRPRRSRSPGVG